MLPADRLGHHDHWVDRILDDELKIWLRANIGNGAMSVRAMVVLRDLDVCWLCNDHVSLAELSMDHVVPKSHGGTNDASNLRVAHKSCNSRRSNFHCPRCDSEPHICRAFIRSRAIPKMPSAKRKKAKSKGVSVKIVDSVSHVGSESAWDKALRLTSVSNGSKDVRCVCGHLRSHHRGPMEMGPCACCARRNFRVPKQDPKRSVLI